ncbi:MAG: hypothetical protein ACTSRK_14235 [Promethearchaeota archaeon]
MAKILISYNKTDHACVDKLKNFLRYPKEDYLEMMDRSASDIGDEEKFYSDMNKKVDKVDAILYIQGATDRRTRFITHQLKFAQEENIPIIPIRISNQRAPLPDSLEHVKEVSFDEKHIKLEIWNQLKKLYE